MKKKSVFKCVIPFVIVILLFPFLSIASDEGSPVNRLDEVVVTGTRTQHTLKDVPVETVVITRDDIEKFNAQTIADALKSVSGISTAGVDDLFGNGSSSSRARLHGLSFNDGYGLILIDGQRVHGSSQSGGHGEYAVGLNQIPISMIERIEIVKGPSSVLYGSDAMAGVINIITRKTPKKSVGSAGAAYGWYKVKERVRDGVKTYPADRGEYRHLTDEYVYFGDQPTEDLGYIINYAGESGESNGSSPTVSKRHSMMGKIDKKLSHMAQLSVKGEGSKYERERDGYDPTTEDSFRLSAGLTLTPNDKNMILVKGYHYLDYFQSESSSARNAGDIGYDQVEVQYTATSLKNHQITAGGEFQRQGMDYTIDNYNANHKTTVKKDVDTFSLYIQDEILFFDKIMAVPGIRFDHHSSFDESVNPKLSVMCRLGERTTLRGSVGRSFKSPTIRQLYYDVPVQHGSEFLESNPDLEPETSIGYTLSVEQWLFHNNLILNLGYFRNDINDKVVQEDTGKEYNGNTLYTWRNVEEMMSQGIEMNLRLQLGRSFLLTAAYTYTDSEDKESGNDLTYTPDHEFSFAPVYEYQPLGLGITANVSYFSDQYSNSANTRIIDSHCVVDAKCYKWLSRRAKLSLEADNLFDSDKGDERSYRMRQTYTLHMDINF